MSVANDKYWTEVAEYLRRRGGDALTVLGPADFREILDMGLAYEHASFLDLPSIGVAVLHKGQLDRVDPALLVHIASTWTPVFANEVFVVLGRSGTPLNSDEHMQSFFSKFRQLAQSGSAMVGAGGWDGSLFNIGDLRDGARRAVNQDRIRLRCRTAYLGDHTALAWVLGRYKMFVDTTDVGLSTHLLTDGFWEMWITEFVAETVKPGMVVVDVGANLGYYALLLADLAAPDGRLIAIEPNPAIALLLQRSLAVNGFGSRATVHGCALSDRDDGMVDLLIPRSEPKNATIIDDSGPYRNHPDYRIETIEARSLDGLLAAEPRVDFVKIDAEGAERMIWRGMRRTLERNRDIVITLEFNAARYEAPGDFLDEIAAAGFSFRHVDFSGGVKPVAKGALLTERPGEDWMLVLDRNA